MTAPARPTSSDDLIAIARAYIRIARRWLRPVDRSIHDRFIPIRHGQLGLRLVRPGDGADWTAAQRANAFRMQRWWNFGSDWERATDRIAFHQHLLVWRRRHRFGAGLLLALTDADDRLVGEIQHWNMSPSGGYAELGFWARPLGPASGDFPGLLARHFDNCFERYGIQRIDAPVPVENHWPLRVLQGSGFVKDATIPRWRVVGGERHDMDLWGLTDARWRAIRAEVLGDATRIGPPAPQRFVHGAQPVDIPRQVSQP